MQWFKSKENLRKRKEKIKIVKMTEIKINLFPSDTEEEKTNLTEKLMMPRLFLKKEFRFIC